MGKILLVLCLTIMFFSGCESQNEVSEMDTFTELETTTEGTDEVVEMETSLGNESTLEISVTNDFTISAQKISPTGIEMKISNNSSKTLYWGSWFTIEKKENDVWYEVNLLELEDGVERAWTDVLAFLDSNETRNIEHQWENGYGALSKGDYRIVKDFFWDERNQDEKIYVACEFTIE